MQGPKTIDQIHQEAEKEKKNQQLQEFMNKNVGGGRGPHDRMDRGGQDNRKRSSRGPQRGEQGGGGGHQNDEALELTAEDKKIETLITTSKIELSHPRDDVFS